MQNDLEFTDYVPTSGVTALPTFRGYTIDFRLEEFRRFVLGERQQVISFNSPEGQILLAELDEYISEYAPESVVAQKLGEYLLG